MKKTVLYFAGFVFAFSIPVTVAMVYSKTPVSETSGWYGLVVAVAIMVTVAFAPWEKK